MYHFGTPPNHYDHGQPRRPMSDNIILGGPSQQYYSLPQPPILPLVPRIVHLTLPEFLKRENRHCKTTKNKVFLQLSSAVQCARNEYKLHESRQTISNPSFNHAVASVFKNFNEAAKHQSINIDDPETYAAVKQMLSDCARQFRKKEKKRANRVPILAPVMPNEQDHYVESPDRVLDALADQQFQIGNLVNVLNDRNDVQYIGRISNPVPTDEDDDFLFELVEVEQLVQLEGPDGARRSVMNAHKYLVRKAHISRLNCTLVQLCARVTAFLDVENLMAENAGVLPIAAEEEEREDDKCDEHHLPGDFVLLDLGKKWKSDWPLVAEVIDLNQSKRKMKIRWYNWDGESDPQQYSVWKSLKGKEVVDMEWVKNHYFCGFHLLEGGVLPYAAIEACRRRRQQPIDSNQ